MTKEQAELILTFAKCNMNRAQTAKTLFVHPTTVHYRIGLIKKEYGLDAEVFYDLCRLVVIASSVAEVKGE